VIISIVLLSAQQGYSFIFTTQWRWNKGKGKAHPRTGHESQKGEFRYNFTLPLTSALDGGGVVNAMLRPLYPRERPGTHCIGGWVGPRAGLDRCGKSLPHRDSIPGPPSP